MKFIVHGTITQYYYSIIDTYIYTYSPWDYTIVSSTNLRNKHRDNSFKIYPYRQVKIFLCLQYNFGHFCVTISIYILTLYFQRKLSRYTYVK